MDVSSVLAHLKSQPWYDGQIVHREDVPPRDARTAELNSPLDSGLQASLESAGIAELYSHQAEAIEAARHGENVIVSTPAASGKSLCYQLPVLDALLRDRSAHALYIFPTKALTQDQSNGLAALVPPGSRLRHGIFDGDTSNEDRTDIRRHSRIVLTNPDMLHTGILPNHGSWNRMLSGLKFVVIDEAHVYRGVFGSQVANVIRRLRRICRRTGNEPQFILCSATLSNAREHAERLVGVPFRLVDADGAPSGGKDFVFWNPPMADKASGSRRNTHTEAGALLVELLRRRIRTLAFVRSRRMAELMYVSVRDRLAEDVPGIASQLAPYRASYLPEDRRRIERDLFEGRLLGLTTTNALELGIDIGDLDATILSGYPGSIASTWQQTGRSGRRGERGLSVLVAQDNPLDQYLMRHPEAFFGKSHESARISPGNPHVLKPQLLCAAYEAPLAESDSDILGPESLDYVDDLADEGLLHRRNGRWHLVPDIEYPAQDINIRSSSSDYYTLAVEESGVVLETVDESSAFSQLHQGAVYLHQGEPYLINELDIESRTAYAASTDVPYYTEVRDFTDTRILATYREKSEGRTRVYLGEVSVTTTVVGFLRKAHFTSQVLGEESLDLPPRTYNTVSLWFDIPPETVSRIRSEGQDLAGGLHAMEHAAIGVLPIFALCDRNDIGGLSTPLHPDTDRPEVFIHDGHPGGVGITEHGYDVIEELWTATLEVVESCPCEAGCPSCIHSPKCGNNNEPLDKDVAIILLRDILG